jgi:hypothetical protein
MNTFWVGLHEPARLFIGQAILCGKEISLHFLVFLDLCRKRADGNGEGHEWGQLFTVHARAPLHNLAPVPAAGTGGATEGTPGLVDEIQSLQ